MFPQGLHRLQSDEDGSQGEYDILDNLDFSLKCIDMKILLDDLVSGSLFRWCLPTCWGVTSWRRWRSCRWSRCWTRSPSSGPLASTRSLSSNEHSWQCYSEAAGKIAKFSNITLVYNDMYNIYNIYNIYNNKYILLSLLLFYCSCCCSSFKIYILDSNS